MLAEEGLGSRVIGDEPYNAGKYQQPSAEALWSGEGGEAAAVGLP
jgi:hypothetical protein